MGRKPTPTVLKLLRGNPGKRRIDPNEANPEAASLRPPADLDDEARAEWRRTGPVLAEYGLITSADVPAFTAYCRTWSRYVRCEAEVQEHGEITKTSNGNSIRNLHLAVANQALEYCQKFWSDFGMTPSARTKVKVSSERKRASADEKKRASYT